MNLRNDVLAIKNLRVSFVRWGQEIEALKGISITITRGEWVILAGANGAGKSVCLRAISRRVLPSAGQIWVEGNDLASLAANDLARRIFMIHQDPLLGTAPILTVFENLVVADEVARQERESKRQLVQKYRDLLLPLGLGDRLKQPVKTLSGGERQLLALAIAHLRPSTLVLLDEVSAALDPLRTRLCLQQLENLHHNGRTLIQVTHDEKHIATLGTRTVLLQSGQVVYDESGDRRTYEVIRDYYQPVI